MIQTPTVSALITIKVNGKNTMFEGSPTVTALLDSLNINAQQVAVAISGEVLPRDSWATTEVRDGDAVEIVRAVGGG
jgi:thiamine biosynthesis protein ThiS